jgi:hypothetical protein
MKLYHKVFKNRPDLSIYLENQEPLVSYCDELLGRLSSSQNMEELCEAKKSILKDFRDIYLFDLRNAEFPEPIGHFKSEKEKRRFVGKKILLQDMVWYLGSIYKKYHTLIYENSSELPAIEMKKLAIDYNEIYQKAMDDYISAITYGRKHAITASFVLPSLIEQGLSTNLQNRLLFKSICSLPDERNLSRPLDTEEQEYISAFLHNTRNFQFNASESYVMGKMYELFVREGVLKASAEMEMILTGVGHERQKKLTRTLNTLLKTNFARKEIRTEYLELMKDLFVKLNIRNSIMHGVGETFDYLNLGIVSIMFQLIWDIATCEIFKDEV